MADKYPTNDEYAKETLRSDGGSAAGGFAAGTAFAKGLSQMGAPFFSIAGLKKSMKANQAEAARELNRVGAAASKKKKKKSKKGPR
jgi:hypothetical protein